MRFYIYSRKSVYTGKGKSIENQIEMCKQYIETKFTDIPEKEIVIYEDEGFSAKNTERPQFQKMLRDIKLEKPDYIVCYRLDRISRNVSDFSALIEELNNRSISFVCIKEEFDTSKPMGKAMMYIASVFAQLERETIAERVRDNMLMLARTGRWLGGSTPTGYTSEKVQEIIMDGKIKASCQLADNPAELATVDSIFEKYLELQSIAGVSKFLMNQGIKSRNGQYYSLLGIKQILQNPVYCIADKEAWNYFVQHNADVCFEERDCSDTLGLLAYNKRDYKKKSAPRQSMDKWIIAIGKHRGRVTGEKWVAIQRVIEQNIPDGKKPAKMQNDYALLSGLIYCDKCGSRMFAKHRSGRDSFDYICQKKLMGGSSFCDSQNINGSQADKTVSSQIMKHICLSSEIFRLMENTKKNIYMKSQERSEAALDAQIQRYRHEMDNLVRSLGQDNLNDALVLQVSQRADEIDKAIKKLEQEKERIQSRQAGTESKQMEKIALSLADYQTCLENLSISDKRILIRTIVKKILWDGTNLHIYMMD